MDRLTSILLVAGLALFLLAFVLSGAYPYMITDAQQTEASVEEVAWDVTREFKDLKERWPVAFDAAFERAAEALTLERLVNVAAGDPRRVASEDAWRVAHTNALRRGRDLYISEVCWHCHSQYVRPVANEESRFGPVLTPEFDNNALQRPVLWGTRRVGPDLTHEGGLRSNDWHAAHFWDPKSTSPDSVMPRFRWFFREGYQVFRRIDPRKAENEGLDPQTSYPIPGIYDSEEEAERALARIRETTPSSLEAEKERLFIGRGRGFNADGLAITAYMQWLGTWDPSERTAPATPKVQP